MNFIDIILKKRYGQELTDEEIAFFVKGVADYTLPDYQVSALLMAIVLNGMTDREMTTLTLRMAESGAMIDLSDMGGHIVDKHSTGGVGDKVTPLVIPLCAAFGVKTVKLTGRGLGFTGGTVDKLKSIQGFNINIDPKDFRKLYNDVGMVISGQTPDLAPADKVLYSLRDVTGTVDSIPLIASSIMSKKIAGGADSIVLDVTCGSGAYMKTPERARELADAMIRIGDLAGRKTVAVITDMDQPLGRTCGNVLEMQEVYETLIGKGSEDVVEVVCYIAAQMIRLAGKNEGLEGDDLIRECRARLTDGRALEKFNDLILSQGGLLNEHGLPVYVDKPFEALKVTSPETGYIKSIKTDDIGYASVELGAGRHKMGDKIDRGAGICFYAKVGDKVKRGDVLCSLCHGSKPLIDDAKLFDVMEKVLDAYEFSDEPPKPHQAVIDVIGA